MCRRIGIEWACGDTWRTWILCDLAKSKETGKKNAIRWDCPNTSTEQANSPTSRTAADLMRDDLSFFRVNHCCSPDCCQESVDKLTTKVADAKTVRSNANDRRQSKTRSATVGRAKGSYFTHFQDHFKGACGTAFDNGYWMVNAMALEMSATPRADHIPTLDEACIRMYDLRAVRQELENLQSEYYFRIANGNGLRESLILPKAQYIHIKRAIYGKLGKTYDPIKDALGAENEMPSWHDSGAGLSKPPPKGAGGKQRALLPAPGGSGFGTASQQATASSSTSAFPVQSSSGTNVESETLLQEGDEKADDPQNQGCIDNIRGWLGHLSNMPSLRNILREQGGANVNTVIGNYRDELEGISGNATHSMQQARRIVTPGPDLNRAQRHGAEIKRILQRMTTDSKDLIDELKLLRSEQDLHRAMNLPTMPPPDDHPGGGQQYSTPPLFGHGKAQLTNLNTTTKLQGSRGDPNVSQRQPPKEKPSEPSALREAGARHAETTKRNPPTLPPPPISAAQGTKKPIKKSTTSIPKKGDPRYDSTST